MQLDTLRRGMKSAARDDHLIYLDRVVNDTTRVWAAYSEVSPRYDPQRVEAFEAPYARVAADALIIVRADPDPRLEAAVLSDGTARFYWHPDMPSPFGGQDGTEVVAPTSSTRTLMTRRPQDNFMIKTDLDRVHFRFRRRTQGLSVRHGLGVSLDIGQALAAPQTPYGYLPETLGLVSGNPETGTGVIFRELQPRPYKNVVHQLVPGFSLYACDPDNPNDPPLLLQLIQRFGSADPLEYFVETVVGTIQDMWLFFARTRGLLLDLHGQNSLFELDEEGQTVRGVVRDFQGVFSDGLVREQQGLPQLVVHVFDGGDRLVREQQYSLCYDHLMGRYFLDRMAKVFILAYDRYDFQVVAGRIAQRFRRVAGQIAALLPTDTTYCFGREPTGHNQYPLVSTSTSPVFR